MHGIYTLEAMYNMNICKRMLDPNDDIRIRYDFKIPVDTSFSKIDTDILKESFCADTINICFYFDPDENEDILCLEIGYEKDLIDVCDGDD
jgi:hypothetical protein